MQVAIITGAGSGIGLGTAEKLADAGMAIVGVGRDPDKLKDLEKAVGKRSELATLSIDVTADDAPKRIADLAMEKWGRIDFLINNAGIGSPKPVHETDDEFLDYSLNLMLRAPFRMTREALKYMKSGAGIVFITSTYAVVGGRRGGAYSAAKAGLHGLMSHIACDYGPLGIRCNSVAPGVIPTPMTAHRLKDEKFVRMNVEMTPFPRLGTVEDIAATVAFLCSEGAAFITNQIIVVDGGWSSTKYLSPHGLNSDWVPRG